jgi:predicted nucleotidyltransferase
MDKRKAIKIAQDFAMLIKDKINPSKVFLYGSYANDTFHENSDIDIAIIVKKLNGDYLSNLNMLYKLRRQINIFIEPVIFIEAQDPSGFLEYIEKNGVLAYFNNSINK